MDYIPNKITLTNLVGKSYSYSLKYKLSVQDFIDIIKHFTDNFGPMNQESYNNLHNLIRNHQNRTINDYLHNNSYAHYGGYTSSQSEAASQKIPNRKRAVVLI